MRPDFERDTALVRAGVGGHTAVVSPHWSIGRGANGGLLAALALRAALLELDDAARKPRSLTVHFLSPAENGELELHATIERSGGRVSNVVVRLEQEGRAVALALGVFALESPGGRSFSRITAPNASPPGSLDALVPQPGTPTVMQNFDYRFAFGQWPFSRAAEASAGIWVRTAERRRPDPIAIAAFTDSWAPMPFALLERPAAAPTLDLTIHFRDHSWYGRAADDAFVLASFRTRLVSDGFFEEDGELWSDDGTLLAQSRQLAMLIE